MVGARTVDDTIFGQGQAARLQGFLQACLGILELLGIGQCLDGYGEQAPEQFVGRGIARVEVHGADHGLEDIGQRGTALETAAPLLARAHGKQIPEIQFTRHPGQCPAIDQGRAHARKVTLVQFWTSPVKHLGDRQADHGIAQEFESLVMNTAGAAMPQPLFSPGRILELVCQSSFQPGNLVSAHRSTVSRGAPLVPAD